MMGMMLVRDLATLIKSRPGRWENSTAYTEPVGPTMSDTCDTEVPAAAPRYRTLDPGLIQILSTPPKTAAATGVRNREESSKIGQMKLHKLVIIVLTTLQMVRIDLIKVFEESADNLLHSRFERKGFHTRYSTLVTFPSGPGGPSTLILFSP